MLVQAVRRAAQIRKGEVATICAGRTRTWLEFHDRVASLAGALRSLGVGTGDRIGILSLNSDFFLELLYATWWVGGVVVPMNTRWAIREHVYSIEDSGAELILVDDSHLEIAGHLSSAKSAAKFALGHFGDVPTPAQLADLHRLARDVGPVPCDAGQFDDLAGIFYTGGTTGHPKGVMHSYRSLWSGATNLALSAGAPRSPRYLHAAPLFHLGDLQQALAVTGLAGTHVFVPTFTPVGVSQASRDHEVNWTIMVPTMIGMLFDHPDFDPADFQALRLLKFGGSPVSDALLERMRHHFPHARLIQDFGQTETAACGATLHYEDHPEAGDPRHRSAGQALFGCRLGIFADNGRELPADEIGEIRVASEAAMVGYWNQPELTAQTLQDGWVRTGDAGRLDDAGYLFVCDRVKDMIISGGENVYSAEVENAIASHPSVQQVAVIGVPDDRWGERVHAVVVCRADATVTVEDLRRHCRPLIAGYKQPRSIELRDEPLPVSAVGKVLKTALRAPHWGDQSRNIN